MAQIVLKECPRCKQGSILSVRVKKKDRVIYLCDEYEAVWFCADSIEYATFGYFSHYMERLGLPDEWSELEVLEGGE